MLRDKTHTSRVILGNDLSLETILEACYLGLKLLLGLTELLYLTLVVLQLDARSPLLSELR